MKLAASQASMATPAKPMSSPRMRERVGLSLSQSQATTAPNMGTDAFKMADNPVLIDSSANAKQANGMPELSMPMKATFFQCLYNSGSKPRSHTSGIKNNAATATRIAAVGSGPNSTTPMRVNKNDAPHMAASRTKSVAQFLGAMVVVVVCKTFTGFLFEARLQASGVQFYGATHPHNL